MRLDILNFWQWGAPLLESALCFSSAKFRKGFNVLLLLVKFLCLAFAVNFLFWYVAKVKLCVCVCDVEQTSSLKMHKESVLSLPLCTRYFGVLLCMCKT